MRAIWNRSSRRRSAIIGVLAGLVCLTSSCVGPATRESHYRADVANTAKVAGSAVASAQLTVQAVSEGRSSGPYTGRRLTEDEQTVQAATTAFSSVQPPTPEMEGLRSDVIAAQEDASTVVAALRNRRCDVRIAVETLPSSGYVVANHFGWRAGKYASPVEATRFSTVVIVTLLGAAAFALTTIDPITITIYAVYLGAATLPFTYIPILVIANDERYLGDLRNGRLANAVGVVYMVVVTAAAIAALPLLIATKGGL